MDNLTIALCMSVGSAVAWLVALYSEQGAYLLIWNVAFGMIGAALCAVVAAWIEPTVVVIVVLTAGPLFSLLAIAAGEAVRRAVTIRMFPPP